MIHTKHQAYFSVKNNKKQRLSFATVLCGALKIKRLLTFLLILFLSQECVNCYMYMSKCLNQLCCCFYCSYECSNPVFGQSHNPYDVNRGPGGSTGGEGALIGAGASVIGFGSDIGGSIRVPSHMCGCCGLKTTLERLR